MGDARQRMRRACVVLASTVLAGCSLLIETSPLRPSDQVDAAPGDGERLAVRWLGTAAGGGSDSGFGCALGDDGEVYWVGHVGANATFPGGVTLASYGGIDAFFVRLSEENGELVGGQTYGGTGTDEFLDVERRGADTWLSGLFVDSVDFGGGLRQSIDRTGVVVHHEGGAYVWDRAALGAKSAVRSLDIGTIGPIIGGEFGEKTAGNHVLQWEGCPAVAASLEQGFVAQLGTAGDCRTLATLPHAGIGRVDEVSAAPVGALYAGRSAGAQVPSGTYLYDLSLGLLLSDSVWGHSGGDPSTQELVHAVASIGDVAYWSGSFAGSTDFGDGAGERSPTATQAGFLHGRTSTGIASTWVFEAEQRLAALDVAIAPSGSGEPHSVFMSGVYEGDTSLGLGDTQGEDGFLIKVDPATGAIESSVSFGGPGDQTPRDIDVSSRFVCVVGYFTEALVIDGLEAVEAVGGRDAFILLLERLPPAPRDL